MTVGENARLVGGCVLHYVLSVNQSKTKHTHVYTHPKTNTTHIKGAPVTGSVSTFPPSSRLNRQRMDWAAVATVCVYIEGVCSVLIRGWDT